MYMNILILSMRWFSFFIFILISTISSANSLPWINHPDYLIFGVPNKFSNVVDPNLSVDAQTKFVLPLIFEPLISVNAQQELQPVLAKSWVVSPDQKSITITIASGHYFSNGQEVTAYDVENSFRRLCSKGSQSSYEVQAIIGCNLYSPHIYVLNRYQIRFEINREPTIFLYQISSQRSVIVKSDRGKLIGSGPYILDEINPNYLLLSKNKYYYNKISLKNDGLIIEYIDENTINQTLKEFHPDGSIMYRISAISKINNTNYITINDKPYITQILVLNNQRFPFNSEIVRRAILVNLYNQNKISSCLSGAIKAYGIIPNGIGGSLYNMAPETLQPILPAEVFKAVPKLRNHFITVLIPQHLGRKNNCEADSFINAARPYHINVKFHYYQSYTNLWPLYFNHRLNGYVELFITKNREAYTTLQYFTTENSENFANTKDKNLDNLMNNALNAPTSLQRFDSYHKMAQYIEDRAIVIPYYYIGSSNLVSKCLGGVSKDFNFNPFQYLPGTYRITGCKLHF